MKVKVIIEIEENDETFCVTSRPHKSITEAFAEIGGVAEKQRRAIQSINYQRYR